MSYLNFKKNYPGQDLNWFCPGFNFGRFTGKTPGSFTDNKCNLGKSIAKSP